MDIGLVGLLRAAWVAATVPILIAFVPSAHLDTYHKTLLLFAGRGKTLQSSSRRFTVPQKFFTHFYVVATFCTSILLLSSWVYAQQLDSFAFESAYYSNVVRYLTGGSLISSTQKHLPSSAGEIFLAWKSVFLLLLMEIQALRRLYESIYVFNYSTSAQMHIFGYLAGIFFYTAAPLSLCCNTALDAFKYISNQVVLFIIKEKTQTLDLSSSQQPLLLPLLKHRWSQWVGAVIFLWGSIHQYRCHRILGKLREGKKRDDDYIVPDGDWFNVVSSPHYLAEIVIYSGLVVASGGMDLTVWLLFGFVVSNLGLAAVETHRWYQLKFNDYPRNRFALIPYVY